MNDNELSLINGALKHLDDIQPDDVPGKTYAHAVACAWWLQEEFGGDAVDYLDYPNLVDSPDFKNYSEASEIYDKIFTLYIKFYAFTDMFPVYGPFEYDGNSYENRTDLKDLRSKLQKKYQLEE